MKHKTLKGEGYFQKHNPAATVHNLAISSNSSNKTKITNQLSMFHHDIISGEYLLSKLANKRTLPEQD